MSRSPQNSNYDACADLSAVVVTVQDATGSSPDQTLMFHRRAFVGTATPKPIPFTKLIVSASTDDIVVLTYRTDQSCDSCDDGTLTTVGFQWQGDARFAAGPGGHAAVVRNIARVALLRRWMEQHDRGDLAAAGGMVCRSGRFRRATVLGR